MNVKVWNFLGGLKIFPYLCKVKMREVGLRALKRGYGRPRQNWDKAVLKANPQPARRSLIHKTDSMLQIGLNFRDTKKNVLHVFLRASSDRVDENAPALTRENILTALNNRYGGISTDGASIWLHLNGNPLTDQIKEFVDRFNETPSRYGYTMKVLNPC